MPSTDMDLSSNQSDGPDRLRRRGRQQESSGSVAPPLWAAGYQYHVVARGVREGVEADRATWVCRIGLVGEGKSPGDEAA